MVNASKELLRIGAVAERLGVSTRTIKYYEELGLVAPEERSPGGFRLYGDPDIERLRRILRIKGMGFSLAAIREFLAVRDADKETTREAILSETMDHLEEREQEVEGRIRKLQGDLRSAKALRRELQHDINLCKARLQELEKEGT